MPRSRPLIARIRTIHRWVSIAFVPLAAASIATTFVSPPPAVVDTLAAVCVGLLLVLLITGSWIGIHHYATRARTRRTRTS